MSGAVAAHCLFAPRACPPRISRPPSTKARASEASLRWGRAKRSTHWAGDRWRRRTGEEEAAVAPLNARDCEQGQAHNATTFSGQDCVIGRGLLPPSSHVQVLISPQGTPSMVAPLSPRQTVENCRAAVASKGGQGLGYGFPFGASA